MVGWLGGVSDANSQSEPLRLRVGMLMPTHLQQPNSDIHLSANDGVLQVGIIIIDDKVGIGAFPDDAFGIR